MSSTSMPFAFASICHSNSNFLGLPMITQLGLIKGHRKYRLLFFSWISSWKLRDPILSLIDMHLTFTNWSRERLRESYCYVIDRRSIEKISVSSNLSPKSPNSETILMNLAKKSLAFQSFLTQDSQIHAKAPEPSTVSHGQLRHGVSKEPPNCFLQTSWCRVAGLRNLKQSWEWPKELASPSSLSRFRWSPPITREPPRKLPSSSPINSNFQMSTWRLKILESRNSILLASLICRFSASSQVLGIRMLWYHQEALKTLTRNNQQD